jgi:hypothetical protein
VQTFARETQQEPVIAMIATHRSQGQPDAKLALGKHLCIHLGF